MKQDERLNGWMDGYTYRDRRATKEMQDADTDMVPGRQDSRQRRQFADQMIHYLICGWMDG